MNNKEFVKTHYPSARVEKQVTNGGKKYYLIRDGRQTMYMASGDTESKAWKNAKENILKKKDK